MDESRCIICQADFRAAVMKDSKCPVCATMFPKAKSREEALGKVKPKAETLTEKRVRDLIYEILEDAGIKRFECEKCKDLFFKNSPAQKQCAKCKESK